MKLNHLVLLTIVLPLLTGCGGGKQTVNVSQLSRLEVGQPITLTVDQDALTFGDHRIPLPLNLDHLNALLGEPRTVKTGVDRQVVHVWDDFGIYASHQDGTGPLKAMGVLFVDGQGGILDPKKRFSGEIMVANCKISPAINTKTLKYGGFTIMKGEWTRELGRYHLQVQSKEKVYLFAITGPDK